MGLSKRKIVSGLVSGGIVLLLSITDASCDELWSRGFLGTPSSGPFRPFDVVILESVTGNHLRAICSFANYSDKSESPPPVKIQGVTKDGKFHPHVFAKVTNEVNGEWKTIGELGVKGKPTTRWVAPKSVEDRLVVELDVFRPLIGTYFYGSVVLPTGEEAVFELKDLLPPGPKADKTRDGLTRSNMNDSTVGLGTESVSYRQATALSAAERYDLTRKAERGDWQAAFDLALYYAGAAPNIKNREYFLTLASKSGSRESIEALADFYSMPGGIFQIQKAISLRRDLKSKFPNEVDNIDWAEGCAFEYHYLATEAARKKEVIFLKLAASLGSTKASAALQKIGVNSTPTAGILAINGKAAMKSVNDHLVPVEEVRDAQSPEAAYERLWRQKLLVTPGEIARSVHLPGTVGVETAVSVYRMPSEREYWVAATQASESLWGCVAPDAAPPKNPNSIEVSELKAQLPETTALALQKVWRAMLLGVREPPKSTEMLLEGSTEIFSAAAADGRVLIGQFQGLGQRNTAALSTLANLLLQYCDSPETERVDIARKIDKAASDLLGRVASTSGSKKRNSKLASSSKAARTPRNQQTSQPTAGRKPTTHVARLGASIDDFRSRWGTPVRGIVFARTTRLVWKPAGRKNKALPVWICEAQVSFLDRIACKIVLQSKQPLTKRKSV